MSDEAIQQQYPDIWKAFLERSADFRFPEGETGEEARQRIADFLEENAWPCNSEYCPGQP
jgi:broad specificity phosphatase PhoE